MSLFRTLLSQLSRLPSEYQEVEWIKGTGTQYINLNLSGLNGILCEYDVVHDSDYKSLDSNGGYIIGSHGLNYPYGRNGGWYKAGTANAWELGYGETYPGASRTMQWGHKYHVKFCTFYDEAYIEVDGVRLITTSGQTVTDNLIYIFQNGYGINYGGPSTIAKLYGAKISKKVNGEITLMRDLVPCYRKSDNEIGMYDLVNGVFYYNAGTGVFKCFPEIPVKYTLLDYLESTGTQYINTGFSATYLTKIDIDFQYTSNTTNGKTRVFGSRRTWKTRGFYGGTDNDVMGEKYWYLIGTLASDSSFRPASINSDTNKHNLVLNKDGGYIDNVLVWTPVNTPTSFVAYSTIALFGAMEGTTPVIQTGICRIFRCKIYANNVLVKDLIPVLDKTNVPCMYDKLNNVFHYNMGSGTFTYGNLLPNEYQAVEWIKGSGKQYINTGYVATGGMTCEFDVTYESDYTTYNSNGGYIIGSHASNYPYGRSGAWYVKSDNKWQLGYGEATPMSSMTLTYGIPYNVKFSTIIGNAWLEVNGERIITDTSTQTITTTPVYVFAHQYDLEHGGGYCTIAKLHYGKIYDSTNTLIREFIPCYRKSDNVIGLYDKVNDVFYTNTGTGTFTKGPDV